MTEVTNSDLQEIDPDPFVLAGLAIAAVSMINGFVHIYQNQRNSPPPAGPHLAQRDEALVGLETQARALSSSFKQIARVVEAGSSNPDGQFYDAPARVGATQMLMDPQRVQQFGQQTGIAYSHAGNMLMWSTNLITLQPLTVFNLGKRLEPVVSQSTDQINTVMAEGRPIRVALQEAKAALAALEAAVDEELNARSSNI